MSKDHGVVDGKGRKLGHGVRIYAHPGSPHAPAGWVEAAPHFLVYLHAQRDGKHFGATRRPHSFATQAEAEAFAALKLRTTKPGKR